MKRKLEPVYALVLDDDRYHLLSDGKATVTKCGRTFNSRVSKVHREANPSSPLCVPCQTITGTTLVTMGDEEAEVTFPVAPGDLDIRQRRPAPKAVMEVHERALLLIESLRGVLDEMEVDSAFHSDRRLTIEMMYDTMLTSMEAAVRSHDTLRNEIRAARDVGVDVLLVEEKADGGWGPVEELAPKDSGV